MKEKIVFRDGTHRIRPPEKTLELVVPHMAAMGITRVADVTGLDTIGIPVVMSCRPNSRSVSVSQGKGSTLAAAKASGLMESIEGFHAENISLPVRLSSHRDLSRDVGVIDIESLPAQCNSPMSPDLPIVWIESEDLMSDSAVWIPFEMVHTNYSEPRAPGVGCFPASSNGLASGNSIAEATLHAICEVIERDAIALWSVFGASAVDATSIDFTTISDPLCVDTLEKLEGADQDTYVWDLTADNGIPTYLSVILDRNSDTRHIGLGSGTHLSRRVALLRALHEAVQVRTTYIVGARDDIKLDEYSDEGIEAKRIFFGRLIEQSSFGQSFDRRRDLDSDTVDADLELVMSRLKLTGINQICRVDLTKPEFEIPVVRVVIPGLESPHDDDGYVPGPRARRARERFGE